MKRMPTARPTTQCAGEWRPTVQPPPAARRHDSRRRAPVGSRPGFAFAFSHREGHRRILTTTAIRPSSIECHPTGTRSEPRPERLRIDPAHLVGVPIDQLVVALDQRDHPPEAQPAEVGVPASTAASMPSSSAPSPPDGVSPASTVGSLSGVTMRRTRSDLPLERFPREESTIARSITQPAPSARRRTVVRHARRPLPHGGTHRRRRHGRGLPCPRRRAGARGRCQGAPPLPRRRSRVRGPVPARGPRRRRSRPPEHRRRLRLGRGGRRVLHGHGVRPGPERPAPPERAGADGAGAGRRDPPTDRSSRSGTRIIRGSSIAT